MLYEQSKKYLLEKLKAAGLKSKPYTTQKGLEKSQESHIGAVLFESEALLRNGSKTRYRDQEGAQKKRRKVFDRALTFTVIIGDYTDSESGVNSGSYDITVFFQCRLHRFCRHITEQKYNLE